MKPPSGYEKYAAVLTKHVRGQERDDVCSIPITSSPILLPSIPWIYWRLLWGYCLTPGCGVTEGFFADTEDPADRAAGVSAWDDLCAGGGYGDAGCYGAVEYGYLMRTRGAFTGGG